MKNEYKKRNKKLRTNLLLIICIMLCTCFLSMGYTAIDSLVLDIEGEAFASAQEGVFISDVSYDSNIDAQQEYSKINSYIQTTLNSTIFLSKTNPDSSITYEVSIYNNSDINYFFTGTSYLENFYDNLGITYELDGIEKWDLLQPKDTITFNIIFSYKDNTLAESNELNSYIEFLFESAQNKVIAELIYEGQTTKKVVSLDEGTTTFDASNIEGTVIRCNNGAKPALSNGTITITGITDNIKCQIFDTLEEAVETCDSSTNNMIMISNEDVTFEDSNNIVVSSNKKINLDLNGKIINANTLDSTVTYIENYGKLELSDSEGNGYIQSNYRAVGNYENGELNIISGTYKRTEEDASCGGTVTNFGGKTIIKNSTLTATSTAAFLNWGTEESISIIDNCTLSTETGDTIINASSDSEISVSNSTITSTSASTFKGAYILSSATDEKSGPIYICNSTLSGVYDYYSYGLGRFYYTSNVTFVNGNNTPSSNNTDSLIKNYITTTDYNWYKVKTKTASGMQDAKYANGKNIRIGDKINIPTLLSSNFLLEVSGEFASGNNIQIYSMSWGAAQQYMFLASSSEGYYGILPYSAPTLSLNIEGTLESGANVGLYTYSDAENQRFELITYDSSLGNYNINSAYDIYLDIEGKVAANWQNVIVYEPDETDSQKWKIEKVEY